MWKSDGRYIRPRIGWGAPENHASHRNERRQVNTNHNIKWFQIVVWNKVMNLVSPNCTQPWSDCQIWPSQPSSWCKPSPAASNTSRIRVPLNLSCWAFQGGKSILVIYTRDYTDWARGGQISNPAQPLELTLTDSPQKYPYLMSYCKISQRWFQKS